MSSLAIAMSLVIGRRSTHNTCFNATKLPGLLRACTSSYMSVASTLFILFIVVSMSRRCFPVDFNCCANFFEQSVVVEHSASMAYVYTAAPHEDLTVTGTALRNTFLVCGTLV